MIRPFAAIAALATLVFAALPAPAQGPGSQPGDRIARLEGVWRLQQTPDPSAKDAKPSATTIEITRAKGRLEVRERIGGGAWQEQVVRPARIGEDSAGRIVVRFLRLIGRQVERIDLTLEMGGAGASRASVHRGRYARAVLPARETTTATLADLDSYLQPLKRADDAGNAEIERLGIGILFAAPAPI